MNGDPKVVAALAIAILALPPVVNAIMAKAAEQADSSWLRDQDFDGNPDIDDPPPLEHRPPPGETPPPDIEEPPPREQPPPPCEPRADGVQETLEPADRIVAPQGALPFSMEENHARFIQMRIEMRQVTGSPQFALLRDGDPQWDYNEQSFTANPPVIEQEFPAAPGETWSIEYDVGGAVFQEIVLVLATQLCEVPADA